MGVWVLIAALSAFAADCPSREAAVVAVERMVVEGRLAEVPGGVDAAQATFACGGPAERLLLARLWLAEGASYAYSGDAASAEDAIAASVSVMPGFRNPDLGPAIAARQEALSAKLMDGPRISPGLLRIEPDVPGRLTYLDGLAVVDPVRPGAGLHLVQVGDAPGDLRFARFMYVASEASLVLETGLPTELVASVVAPLPETPLPKPPSGRPAPVFLLGGGGALVGGALFAGLALRQDDAMREAGDLDSLDAAFARQKGFAAASYALLGAGALGLTLHVVR